MVKLILFDFFGVLCPDVYWEWLTSENLDNSDNHLYLDQIVTKFDTGEITRTEFYLQVAQRTERTPEEVASGMWSKIKINQQLVELLADLRERFKLGLLSNSDGPYLREILAEAELLHAFDHLLISSETTFEKPDPQAYQNALKIFEVAAQETIFIDDRPVNIEAARTLGIKTFLYENTHLLVEDLVLNDLL